MTPLDAMPINHDGALQLALIKQDESNLARCYLELRMQMERDAAMQSLTDVQQEMEKQEPVAWRWRESIWFDWTTDWTHHDRAKAMGCPIEYAYTPHHRAPIQPAQRLCSYLYEPHRASKSAGG